MKRNGCPVAMETVEHRNFCGENASNFMAQVNFFKEKKREFCLKTQFGQSLQVDVSVIILAGKKIETNSFINKFEFFAAEISRKKKKKKVSAEQQKRKVSKSEKEGEKEEIGTECAKWLYSSASSSTTTGRRETAFFLADLGASARPACTSVSRRPFRSSSP